MVSICFHLALTMWFTHNRLTISPSFISFLFYSNFSFSLFAVNWTSNCIFLQIYHQAQQFASIANETATIRSRQVSFFKQVASFSLCLKFSTIATLMCVAVAICCFFYGFSDLILYIWSVAAMPFLKTTFEIGFNYARKWIKARERKKDKLNTTKV